MFCSLMGRSRSAVTVLISVVGDTIDIQLTPDQEAFIRRAVESGRLQNSAEAVQEALSLWEERERRRMEILTAVDRAEASLSAGLGHTITAESMRALADEVKRGGRSRLATEQSPPG
jgi:putative addiction module CopG family antidote